MAKFGNSVIDLAYLCSYLFVLASLILGSIIVVADDVKYAEGSLAGFHTVGSGVGALLILLGILACCFGIPASCIELIWPANGKKEVLSEDWLMQYASKIPIIYRDEYNITAYGLENLHPFDSQKYGHIVEQLVEQKLLQTSDLIKPEMVSTSDLLFVHSRLYLASLHSTLVLTRILEIPVILALPSVLVRWKVINPMRFQTQGTILAGRVALERGWCINLGGGFHHASAGSGGGFCPLADLTLSIRMLQRDYPDRVKNVMLIDLDAHQGNGHERDFLKDDSVFIVDFYNSQIYPGDEFAKKGISMNVPLKRSMHNDTKYLPLLKQKLEESFDRFKPDIIYYNAGTDCMEGDPLGDMDLTPDGIVQRDEIVFDAAFSRKLPIVMVLSGGYQKSNAFVIALSIANLKKKFKLWTRAGEEKQEERRSRSPSGKSSKKRKSKKKTSEPMESPEEEEERDQHKRWQR